MNVCRAWNEITAMQVSLVVLGINYRLCCLGLSTVC